VIREVQQYRRDVRYALQDSDLPLRIAAGQVDLPPVRLKLTQSRGSIEDLALQVARTLPRHTALHSASLQSGFALVYYAVAGGIVLILLQWLDLTYAVDDKFGLLWTLLPLLCSPILGFAYRDRVHAEELLRLLREHLQS
jgi:hypothetical protein